MRLRSAESSSGRSVAGGQACLGAVDSVRPPVRRRMRNPRSFVGYLRKLTSNIRHLAFLNGSHLRPRCSVRPRLDRATDQYGWFVKFKTRSEDAQMAAGSLVSTWPLIVAILGFAESALAEPTMVPPSSVVASNTYSGLVAPSYATDGNSLTMWSAGAVAPQWIQLDLGKTVPIDKIRLQVAQETPSGNTTHVVQVGQNPSTLTSSRPGNGTQQE